MITSPWMAPTVFDIFTRSGKIDGALPGYTVEIEYSGRKKIIALAGADLKTVVFWPSYSNTAKIRVFDQNGTLINKKVCVVEKAGRFYEYQPISIRQKKWGSVPVTIVCDMAGLNSLK